MTSIKKLINYKKEIEKDTKFFGTTKEIGSTYASKAVRTGIRIGDLVGGFAAFSEKFIALESPHKKTFLLLK